MTKKETLATYGLKSREQLKDIIAEVCSVLGNGINDNADKLLFRIAIAESNGGETEDTSTTCGFGVFQFDPVGVEDVISRTGAILKLK